MPLSRGRAVVAALLLSSLPLLTACGGAGSSPPPPAPECATAADCPGADTDCRVRTCTAGACGVSNVAAGTAIAAQTAGDCLVVQCDGAGAATPVADDADLPSAGSACATPSCTMGVPGTTFAAAGTACSDAGGTQCDGSGACVACLDASECPGPPSPCVVPTCTAGTCGTSNAPDGAVVVPDALGDCRTATTCSAGVAVQVPDDADVPVDGNACTSDVCTSGVPSNPNVAAGAACAQGGGTQCDGNGACVECLSGSDCASLVCAAGACQPATCQDRVKNGDETDLDCGGGTCPACAARQACLVPADCRSGACFGGTCGVPAVAAITPSSDATGVSAGASVVATFNVPMDAASLAGQPLDGPCAGTFQLSADGFASCVAVSGAAMTNGGATATWTPAAPLAYLTTYSARITSAALTPGGEPLPSAFTSSFTTEAAPAPAGAVVISQVYGGGGNSGAPYTNDFVELHNRTAAPVSISGWTIQYASAAGTTWQVTPLAGTIPAGGYFLVQEAAGASPVAPLPTPDVAGSIPMAATAGKVALVASATPLAGTCPGGGAVRDLVGYGIGTGCAEGTAAAAPSNTTAILRSVSACRDTENNSADFVVAAPAPRNSASAPVVCGAAVNGTGLPQEADWCNVQFPASFTVATGQAAPIVYGRVFELGVTAAAGASPSVVAQLGFGGWGTNPVADPAGWAFVDAAFNVQAGNDDEYQASFTAPAPGTWGYAYRFSVDGGATWTYCDLDGAGSNAGLSFSASQLGQLTVTP